MTATEARVDPGAWDTVLTRPDGPQLVVAGPGTGKTEFLVQRVAAIVDAGHARRDQIAFLTFSRRAAADVRRRIAEELTGSAAPVDVSTFHSLAIRLIETATGERPVPLLSPEQVTLVSGLLTTEDPSHWPLTYRDILGTRVFAGEIADFLTRCSERLLSPDDLEDRARERPEWRGIPGLFARYRAELETRKRTDYGTLLVATVELLGTAQGRELASRFRYVLVDEYQDTTPAQAAIARLLAAPHGNLTVAGDPYQSIYSFRGAELRNIASFADEHPDLTRIVLDQSLRVPAPILDAAVRVVSSGDLPGSAGPVQPAPHQGRVDAFVFDQQTAEADWIAREVDRLIRVEGLRPAQIAVLVRSKRELITELSRALDQRRIPHDQPDSRLVDHPAVRLFDDLAKVARGGGAAGSAGTGAATDADRAMRRILLGPLFSLSLGEERSLLRERRRGRSWLSVIGSAPGAIPKLAPLLEDTSWADRLPAGDGFWAAWTGLEGAERLVDEPERGEWRAALTAFAQVLTRQAERDDTVTLTRFFEVADEENFEPTPLLLDRLHRDRVTLTTLHQSKGLEFEVVFIANAVEGVFPDLRRSRRMLRPELLSPERPTDATSQLQFQVQEEMRIAYTAMTRARRRVVWTATSAGVDQGEHRPSRFLLAASGADTLDEIGAPAEEERPPVTMLEAEVALRRRLLDPNRPAVERLAAARVLGRPPSSWWDPAGFAGVAAPGPDRPVLGDAPRLSPSQADAYARCPRRYVLERRLRLSDSSSPYAHFGTLIHTVLERAEGEVIGTGRRHADLDAALAHLRAVWEEEADFGTEQLNRAWLIRGEDLITRLYETWPPGDSVPIELETRVDAEIGGIPWTGIIDRLEQGGDGLRVVDYKTSKTQPRVEDAKRSIQLGFYATALASRGPVAAAEMWYPAKGSVRLTTRKLDMGLIGEIEDEMLAITGSIVAEEWAPRPSEDCEKCAFRSSCPAWPEGRGAYLP